MSQRSSPKCGVYEIRCVVSGKSYVGSSIRVGRRWCSHRTLLRKGTHPSPRLQQAWNKHGQDKFVFSILEECAAGSLLAREQFHIDARKRDYNSMPRVRVFTAEMVAKRIAKLRLRAEAITQCPKGHEYTSANTYVSAGKRRCKECNKLRIAAKRASESVAMRDARLAQMREYHMINREAHNAKMRAQRAG